MHKRTSLVPTQLQALANSSHILLPSLGLTSAEPTLPNTRGEISRQDAKALLKAALVPLLKWAVCLAMTPCALKTYLSVLPPSPVRPMINLNATTVDQHMFPITQPTIGVHHIARLHSNAFKLRELFEDINYPSAQLSRLQLRKIFWDKEGRAFSHRRDPSDALRPRRLTTRRLACTHVRQPQLARRNQIEEAVLWKASWRVRLSTTRLEARAINSCTSAARGVGSSRGGGHVDGR